MQWYILSELGFLFCIKLLIIWGFTYFVEKVLVIIAKYGKTDCLP